MFDNPFQQIGIEAVLDMEGFHNDVEVYNKDCGVLNDITKETADNIDSLSETTSDLGETTEEVLPVVEDTGSGIAGMGDEAIDAGAKLLHMNSKMAEIMKMAMALAPEILGIGAVLAVAGKAMIDFIKDTKGLADVSLELQIPIEEIGKFNELSLRTGTSLETLKGIMVSMQDNGYEPTLESLTKLVIKYQQLPPGIERVEFTQKNFGTSTAEVQRLLTKNPAIFQESGRAAERLSSKYSAAAEQMALAMENAQQRMKTSWKTFWSGLGQGVSVSFFASLFPKSEGGIAAQYMMQLQAIENMQNNIGNRIHTQSGAVITVTEEMIKKAQEEADKFALQNGLLSDQEYQLKKNLTEQDKQTQAAQELLDKYEAQQKAVIEFGISGAFTQAIVDYQTNLIATQEEIKKTEGTIKWMEGMVRNAPSVIKDLQDAMALEKLEVSDQSQRYEDLNIELEKWLNIQNNGPQFIQNWKGAIGETEQKQKDLEAQLRKTTAEMILQQVSSSLTAQAQLEFARATGLMSEADYTLASTATGLTNIFDTNHDGIVSGTEDVKGYKDALITLARTAQDAAVTGEQTKTAYYTSTGQAVSEIKAKTDQAILDAATAKMTLINSNKAVFDALKQEAGDTESIVSNTHFWEPVGKGMIDGMVLGIETNKSVLFDATRDLANKMEEILKAEWGIKSPSKVFAKIGKQVVQGLVGGINSQEALAISSMNHVAQALAVTAAGGLSNIPTTTSMMIPEIPRASSQATAPVAENASGGSTETNVTNMENNITTQGATAQEIVQQISNAELLNSYRSPIVKPSTLRIGKITQGSV